MAGDVQHDEGGGGGGGSNPFVRWGIYLLILIVLNLILIPLFGIYIY